MENVRGHFDKYRKRGKNMIWEKLGWKAGRRNRGIGIFVICLLGLLLLGGCREFNPLELDSAPELVEAIKANRVMDPLSEEEAREKIKGYLYPYDEFAEVDPEKIRFLEGQVVSEISREDALEEIDFLFKMLKYGYAGYGLFGGDETFARSKEKIKEEIRELEVLPIAEYRAIIIENLSFINDGHFRIGNQALFTRHHFHYSREIDFARDERGFYTISEGENNYLDSVNGKDPEEYLKLSLNEEGKLVYRLAKVTPGDGWPYPVTLSYADNRRPEEEVNLFPIQSRGFDRVIYDSYEKDGLPVVVNRIAPGLEEAERKRFTEGAKELKDAKVAILDIRGHVGGSDMYGRGWVKNYTSSLRTPARGGVYVDLRTQTAQQFLVRWNEGLGLDAGWARSRFSPVAGGWSDINFSNPRFQKNDRYLIVLIDDNNASAGESFVRFLKQVENVIIIGSNTSGVSTVGNVGTFFLPTSAIPIQMGVSIFLGLDLEIREGIGIEPDIWVDPRGSVELAVKFANNYLR